MRFFLVLFLTLAAQGFTKDLFDTERTKKDAEQGDPIAQTALGSYYKTGWGDVPKNPTKAFEWYKKAADQGYATAIARIGTCYEYGIGVPKNPRKAFECYEKAANISSHFFAQKDVARCYVKGIGVCPDGSKALEIYRRLADGGEKDGLYYLGVCYYDGVGVPKDAVRAYAYFNASAAMDDDNAKEIRGVLEKEMTLGQIAEAQKLSKEIFEKFKDEQRQTEELIQKYSEKK